MTRLIIFWVIYLLLQLYAFQAIRTISKNSWLAWGYWLVGIGALVTTFLVFRFGPDRSTLTPVRSYAIGFMLILVVFYLCTIIVMFGEDIFRLLQGVYQKLFTSQERKGFLPERRKFLSQLALGIAAIPFSAMLYGIFKGKYNYKVLKYQLYYPDLPEAFDGYRLTQISDIHSGSFDNKEKIEYAVDLINEQQSDAILFTGDMVNNKAEEMLPWKSVFGKLKATDGVYSVLGNHDYGDYVEWDSEQAKVQNLEDLKNIQRDMGFDLLLNESRFIEKNGQRLALIGVENWGKGGFKKAGDLNRALSGVQKDDFSILMSHDPSHWEAEVLPHEKKIHLTLSGHTHGMQFGIEIPGWFKWSPVQWRYKQWAGIYESQEQKLNVNRGFGYLAFPGRVGIWPEVTVIELKKGENPIA